MCRQRCVYIYVHPITGRVHGQRLPRGSRPRAADPRPICRQILPFQALLGPPSIRGKATGSMH